jgi:hypothetical protein
MEKIQFDVGQRSYRINGAGVLRFNPSDPNVYARFLEAAEKLRAVEKKLTQEQVDSPEALLQCMSRADGQMNEILSWVFGSHNDFGSLLEGVNLLAVADNGERVVTNLFTALEPVLLEGAKRCAAEQTQVAQQKAQARRSSR